MYKTILFTILLLLGISHLSYSQLAEVPEKTDNESNNLSLNGEWFFNPVFKNSYYGMKDANNSWKGINVPGQWLMQGFEVKPGKQAAYFRKFNVPADWKNSTVYLRCDAVFSKADVWVNGKNAGGHTGPMVAFEKDVTDLVKFGKTNRIVMGIVSETMADTLMSGTQYAAHQLGGILRKIYLYAVPKVHLADLSVQTNFDKDFINAELKINGTIINNGKAKKALVTVFLSDFNGNNIPLKDNQTNIQVNGDKSKNINLVFDVKNPLKWDAEHPNLYQLKITVKSDAGEEKIKKIIGFREIEVVGNQLFVNGKVIKLKGVNRHEAHPLRGRSLTPELWKKDAELYKAANVNYIRTSHYPPSEEFIEWCDKIGLYVELENPLSWVGHGANAHWKKNNP
ncbi:MAG: glycoside hydrolase family 2 TIM barrel-domain containing protein, partial [Bacteroidota bacterium]